MGEQTHQFASAELKGGQRSAFEVFSFEGLSHTQL